MRKNQLCLFETKRPAGAERPCRIIGVSIGRLVAVHQAGAALVKDYTCKHIRYRGRT